MERERVVSGDPGRLLAVCIGPGGIPKRAVPEAELTLEGLAGDRSRHRLHGGRDRAVCLLSALEIAALVRDGVPASEPGTFGENLVYEGLDPERLRPGDRLRIGEQAIVELTDVREPCGTLRPLDRRFPDLMLGRSGFMARVVRPGVLAPGLPIWLLAPPPGLRYDTALS